MKKRKNITENEDKFLCFCSKITREKFKKEMNLNYSENLDILCNKLGLAKHCSACLPNIEDEFFQQKGKKEKVKKILYDNNYTFIEKIKNFIDSLSGNTLVSQQGYLPMLASKSIKTWLVVSNEKPSLLSSKIIPYKISLKIFDKEGKKIKKVNILIKPNKTFKVCLNDYVTDSKNTIENYYVQLKRSPTNKGFRGSTRPHFFYQTNSSMATLHTQDGGRKINFVNLPTSKNKDKNFLFLINPSTKTSFVEQKIQKFFKGIVQKEEKRKSFTIPPKGSKLLDLNPLDHSYEKNLFRCKSTNNIKCYYIIADKKFNNISIDHI